MTAACAFCRARQAVTIAYTIVGHVNVRPGLTETLTINQHACGPCYAYLVSLPRLYRHYLARLAGERSDGW